MTYRFASASGLLLAAIAATAQSNLNQSVQTEQVEVGTMPWTQAHPNELHELRPAQSLIHYRIRLLPVSSFPQLPTQAAQELQQKGCMIPQTYEAHEPENVIHGSFEKEGSNDWAALCSVNHITTLYVFFQSDFANPIPLRHQPDTKWLGVEWSLDYGSAWGIATRPERLMEPQEKADHDGIDDAFVEKLTTVHYFRNGRWTIDDLGQ